jgi:RecB family exonuclease
MERVVWPGPGAYWGEVDGWPIRWAARLLAGGDPLGLDRPWILVEDEAAARALGASLLEASGTSAVALARILTPARWLARTSPPERRPPELDRMALRELGRAVETAIATEATGFPGLAPLAERQVCAPALAELFEAMRRAGLASRSAGLVATLERLEAPELAQDLLRALGMLEGRLETLGWWDSHAVASSARDAWVQDGRPWLVVDPGYVPQGLLDMLARVALSAPVIWVLGAGSEPEAPDRRSLRWALAAPTKLPGMETAARQSPAPRVLVTEGPADVAAAAVAEALAHPGSVLVAADPARWAPWLLEACARAGCGLGGDLGRAAQGPVAGWLRAIGVAIGGGLTSARAIDLLDGARRLGLIGWHRVGLGGLDHADARLRAAGATRGNRPVLDGLGREGRPLARCLGRIAGAPTARDALEEVAKLCLDGGLERLVGRRDALEAERWASEAARLADALRTHAARIEVLWQGPVPSTPALTARRIAEALAEVGSPAEIRAGAAGGPVLELRHLGWPVEGRPVVLLAPSEDEMRASAGPASLVPDATRRAVRDLAHWPWQADRAARAKGRALALLGSDRVASLSIVRPRRDARGAEARSWDRLLALPCEEVSPLRREPRLLPPAVRVARPIAVTRWSPTAVDTYRSCPRAYYMEKVLRAEDRPLVAYDPDPASRGTWVHQICRELFLAHPGWWRESPGATQIEAWLRELAHRSVRMASSAGAPFATLQVDAHLAAIAHRLAHHGGLLAGAPNLCPTHFEYELRGETTDRLGARVSIEGRVDRLDLVRPAEDPAGAGVGLLVIDYKTGSVAGYGSGRPLAERKVQLALYAWLAERVLGLPCLASLALEVLGTEPRFAGMARATARPMLGALGDAVPARDWLDEDAFRAHLEEAVQETRRVAEEASQGRFDAAPADPAQCEPCRHRLYCPEGRR